MRNTPAEAGKTWFRPSARERAKKHPRRGGEDLRSTSGSATTPETPPPRRGRQSRVHVYELPLRNTPAEAGKTGAGLAALTIIWKHPRRGGEDSSSKEWPSSLRETPPPRRGRPSVRGSCCSSPRNTPAEAGKTATYGSCLLK